MSELYRRFSKDWQHILDYSDQSLLELFLSESYGTEIHNELNGFYVGKKWLNVTTSMWLQDIEQGLLFKQELYQDPNLPHWFLDKIFGIESVAQLIEQ